METVFTNLLTDEMLKTCRELIPVTRRLNENDDQMLVECFHKFTGAYLISEQIMAGNTSSAGVINSDGTKSSREEN